MKRVILLALLFAINSTSQAQIVEYFSNPQRYFFPQFSSYGPLSFDSTFNNSLGIHFEGIQPLELQDSQIFSRMYVAPENQRLTIYGVALPMHKRNYASDDIRFFNWDYMMDYFGTYGYHVYLSKKTTLDVAENAMSILARSDIKRGEHVIEGTFFQMPEMDTIINNIHPPRYKVIEVYFQQPITVTDTFMISTNIPATHYSYDPYNYRNSPSIEVLWLLLERSADTPQTPRLPNDMMFYRLYYNDFLVPTINHRATLPRENSWGGPFPIIAPPPCVYPLELSVTEQHHEGATIEWDAQYANTSFEIEFGPLGFAEGTGTVVGNIIPNAQHHCHQTISGLPMDADITVRVRAYCQIADGFSEWAEINFHTKQYHFVSTSVNNDSCGYITGGGWYIADTTIRLYAYSLGQGPFLYWSDGSTQNPRIVTVTRDTAFHAIFQCNADGIETIDKDITNVSISPNPTDGKINIFSQYIIKQLTILSTDGKPLTKQVPLSHSTQIDLKQYPSGTYLLQIYTTQGSVTKKLVKQ